MTALSTIGSLLLIVVLACPGMLWHGWSRGWKGPNEISQLREVGTVALASFILVAVSAPLTWAVGRVLFHRRAQVLADVALGRIDPATQRPAVRVFFAVTVVVAIGIAYLAASVLRRRGRDGAGRQPSDVHPYDVALDLFPKRYGLAPVVTVERPHTPTVTGKVTAYRCHENRLVLSLYDTVSDEHHLIDSVDATEIRVTYEDQGRYDKIKVRPADGRRRAAQPGDPQRRATDKDVDLTRAGARS